MKLNSSSEHCAIKHFICYMQTIVGNCKETEDYKSGIVKAYMERM